MFLYETFFFKDGFVKFYLDEYNLPVLGKNLFLFNFDFLLINFNQSFQIIEPVLDKENQQPAQKNPKKSNVQNYQSMVQLTKVEWKVN